MPTKTGKKLKYALMIALGKSPCTPTEFKTTMIIGAIANMGNEMTVRAETLDRLEHKIIRLRSSIEAGHRRIIDLKQGAIQARAVRREQTIQMRMVKSGTHETSVEEAEELIARVLGRDDPFERSEIISEINRDLEGGSIADRMADAGFGPATRATADDVLARLKSSKK